MEDAETSEQWPIRTIRDPAVLRAMAHPLRLRLIELLAVHGPATATRLAAQVGESPANCSWHLRQLAAGGYIEEAPGGTGRRRLWKFVETGHCYGGADDEPELAAAGQAAGAIQLEHEVDRLRHWRAARTDESPEWREAVFSTNSIAWLTADELAALNREVMDLYLRHIQRHFAPETRPAGSRPVRLVAWGITDTDLETPAEPDTPADAGRRPRS
ncbi:helix-turn-helix protein [Stackebrandtia albiflava]|uniref:Helix-turn-helix protein n=1 Tax=Stackebrandtia albiflava TaxID=406432 RepID=A0A562V4U1_9ACTN|nr:helix-turn-helix domain-containing protein [Stackebrandtia albiflava]TWJ12909.1 helix-turn-helix protein [Stackebrandtia albiflava]